MMENTNKHQPSTNKTQQGASDKNLDTASSKSLTYEQKEHDLNAKIIEVTLSIRNQYPELMKFLNEMPVTIPNESNPEITLQALKNYYESLQVLLAKYKLEHPQK